MSQTNPHPLAGPHHGDLAGRLDRTQGKQTPSWDATSYTLSWGGQVVKRFRAMAPAQVGLLTAFEEAGWPAGLPVSCLGAPYLESKKRLRDTVKNLNRSVRPYLHFCQERSGTWLGWSLLNAPAPETTVAPLIATQVLPKNGA